MTRLGKMLVEEGKAEGEELKLITLVVKKIQKNITVPEIADMLEEEATTIQRICDIANKYAPDYNAESIYKELKESK